MFDFRFEVQALDHHRNYVKNILSLGKDSIEEAAPIAYVNYIEQVDVWGNYFVIVAKNVPIHLYEDVKSWIKDLKRSLR